MAIFVQIKAMARQNDMGREGESEARAYLVKHGYNVLHTNWHWHHYELDIIAVKEDEFLLSPEDAVDTKKIRRIVAAADAYVRYFNIDLPVRFDIVTLIKKETGFLIDHIEDAFYAPCR